jgi:hypothetical protein
MVRKAYNKATSMFSGTLVRSIYIIILGLSLFGVGSNDRTEATVLSGQIDGSCHIEALNVCYLDFFSDVIHDESTPIIASRLLANGVVIYEYRNDALNPITDPEFPGQTIYGHGYLAARCGQTYTLEFFAQASDDANFKSVASTRAIPCPASVP